MNYTATARLSSKPVFRVNARNVIDKTGNLPPLPGIYPDYPAPIVRNGSDGRELVMARWGLPSQMGTSFGQKQLSKANT